MCRCKYLASIVIIHFLKKNTFFCFADEQLKTDIDEMDFLFSLAGTVSIAFFRVIFSLYAVFILRLSSLTT